MPLEGFREAVNEIKHGAEVLAEDSGWDADTYDHAMHLSFQLWCRLHSVKTMGSHPNMYVAMAPIMPHE